MYLSKPLYVAITIIIIIIIEYVQHLKVIKSYLLEISIIYLWYKRYLTSLKTLLSSNNNTHCKSNIISSGEKTFCIKIAVFRISIGSLFDIKKIYLSLAF
jgi:hypothetical protein